MINFLLIKIECFKCGDNFFGFKGINKKILALKKFMREMKISLTPFI